MNKVEHLLTCLIEECSEVQKCATKALRFGLDDCYPGKSTTNREDLARKLTDLEGAIQCLWFIFANLPFGLLPRREDAVKNKITKISSMMEYAKKQRTLV